MKVCPAFDHTSMSEQQTKQMLRNSGSHTSSMLPLSYYQTMDSKLIHLCKGSAVIGNSIWQPIGTLLGIFVLQTMFLVCTILVRDKSFAIPISLTIIACTLCCYFFFRTLLTDPGIIPKEYTSTDYHLSRIPKNRYLFQTVMVATIGNRTADIKLCPECLLFRSTDTFHCQSCNVCIIGHDHHCVWMGKCIGKHNYKYFFLFLMILTLMVLTQLSYSAYTAAIGSSSKYISWVVINIIQQLIIGGYSFQLFIFHMVIVYNGQTTRQHIKERDTRHRPKSIRNYWKILSSEPYQPYYEPKKVVAPKLMRLVHDEWDLNTVENKKMGNDDDDDQEEKEYTGQEVSVERQL